jgi:3-hydroxymyristoyl/3-hydroxydecanoyl-(acyl carrier protein) dehydratase
MRYRFIDTVLTLDVGERPRVRVEKTFPPGDDAFSGLAGPERVPNSLVLELQAMTGGHLIWHRLERRRLPLLLKVQQCRFAGLARPGERLTSYAELVGVREDATGVVVAEAMTEVSIEGRTIADGRLLYACVTVPAGVGVPTHEDRP